MKMLKYFLVVIAVICPLSVTSQNLTISFFATELSGCDLWPSKCDAFVIIRCSSFDYDWIECGRTKKIQDNDNPIWTEVFTFDHKYKNGERWRFDLYDADVGSDELIAIFPIVLVDQFVEQNQDLLEFKTEGGRGSLWVQRNIIDN